MRRLQRGSKALGKVSRLAVTGPRAGKQARNIGPMLASPRCERGLAQGHPCRSPAVNGQKRCRMRRAEIRELIREAWKLFKDSG
jgi:hypothetical protein